MDIQSSPRKRKRPSYLADYEGVDEILPTAKKRVGLGRQYLVYHIPSRLAWMEIHTTALAPCVVMLLLRLDVTLCSPQGQASSPSQKS